VSQSGSFNNAYVTQSSDGNTSSVDQSGNGNNAYVTQGTGGL
jgi:hypothetical protein